MIHKIKNSLREKKKLIKYYIDAIRNKDFEPYMKDLDIKGINGRFFFATPQAKEWYDPIKPYAKLEYEWVIQNVPLNKMKIIDGGAHHGQYSVFFALAANPPSKLVPIDPYPMNCALTEINLSINRCEADIQQCAISESQGEVHFDHQSNGRILTEGGMLVNARTLDSILPDADVVKLDVEGAEYRIIPAAVDKMSCVHTWIVEVHPLGNPHPDEIIRCFLDRGFKIYYLNRARNMVEPYCLNTEWRIHSTIFALRS